MDNDILTPKQFGFHPMKSTNVALAHFCDTVLGNMDERCITGAVFLDLAKAFDTVDHQRLLLKLYSIGFSNHSVEWFNSYLENRCQVTAVGNVHSSSKSVPVGVPQGSILGPLLFLIYVNDLPSCLRECDLTLYADDTVIYVSAKDAATLEVRLNADLHFNSKWFFDNLLTLNESKCKFVLFGGTHKLKSF